MKTARDIRRVMNALQPDAVERHFDQDADDIEPYVVCDSVSVRAFNEYVGDGEGLPIALRFLAVDDGGRILIVELPTTVHESTAGYFEFVFLTATGNGFEVGKSGSMTATIAGLGRRLIRHVVPWEIRPTKHHLRHLAPWMIGSRWPWRLDGLRVGQVWRKRPSGGAATMGSSTFCS